MNNTQCSIPYIQLLFDSLDGLNASNYQVREVFLFKQKYPEFNEDLDFCFEVLAGKHKLGYTLYEVPNLILSCYISPSSIKQYYNTVLKTNDLTDSNIYKICSGIPSNFQYFFIRLANRLYKLGYTNKNTMVTDKHCMLALTYPTYLPKGGGYYYLQEKLNGNRCIAYYDFEENRWKYTSRSQKPKDYPFDMSGLDPANIYDGEIMTRGKMSNRDFTTTSGLANSKYGDKSQLMYIIYDILDDTLPYSKRYEKLCALTNLSKDLVILKCLDMVYIPDDGNPKVEEWLDTIVAKGGEGLILREINAPYYHSKHSGDRKPYLLKYKKIKTCDLRIIGYNEGKGKYEGLIGSLICGSDDGQVLVSVSGITDEIRGVDPELLYNKIIEIAYFDISQAKDKSTYSLQFPRFKKWRPDKTETSMF